MMVAAPVVAYHELCIAERLGFEGCGKESRKNRQSDSPARPPRMATTINMQRAAQILALRPTCGCRSQEDGRWLPARLKVVIGEELRQILIVGEVPGESTRGNDRIGQVPLADLHVPEAEPRFGLNERFGG